MLWWGMQFKERFRGYLPVVVDLETGGFDDRRNPILEIGAQCLDWQDQRLILGDQFVWAVAPFEGAEIESASLKVTGIDLDDPQRDALPEREALRALFKTVRAQMKRHGCSRAILVAHNASFDMGFLKRGCERTGLKRNPFHPFSALDTVALAAVAYGHTVLSVVCERAGIGFDNSQAHRAAYDAERTAQLFCKVVNEWPQPGWTPEPG